MARTPMITRTVVTTRAKVMCLDIREESPVLKVVTLPRTYKDNAHLLKAVKNLLDTESFKAVHIIETEELETLYGMSEQKFIDNAEVLPPRKIYEKTDN